MAGKRLILKFEGRKSNADGLVNYEEFKQELADFTKLDPKKIRSTYIDRDEEHVSIYNERTFQTACSSIFQGNMEVFLTLKSAEPQVERPAPAVPISTQPQLETQYKREYRLTCVQAEQIIENYGKRLQVSEAADDQLSISICHGILGEAYLFANKYTLALDHLNTATQITKSLGQAQLEAEWKATEAQVWDRLGFWEKAVTAFTQAYETSASDELKTWITIEKSLMEFGDAVGRDHLDQAIQTAKTKGYHKVHAIGIWQLGNYCNRNPHAMIERKNVEIKVQLEEIVLSMPEILHDVEIQNAVTVFNMKMYTESISFCNQILVSDLMDNDKYYLALAHFCGGLVCYADSQFKLARKMFIESRELFGVIYPVSHPWLSDFDNILYPAKF